MENISYILVAINKGEYLKAILGTTQYMWTKNIEDALRIPEKQYAKSIGQLINLTTGEPTKVAQITFQLDYID
jgi:hypothetical protein